MNLTKENLFSGDIFDPYSFLHIINGFNISLFLELFFTKDKNKIFIFGFIFHLFYELKDFLNYYKYKIMSINQVISFFLYMIIVKIHFLIV